MWIWLWGKPGKMGDDLAISNSDQSIVFVLFIFRNLAFDAKWTAQQSDKACIEMGQKPKQGHTCIFSSYV
jgi:hypothetical protein